MPVVAAPKPVKRDDLKGPKPENVNALRNALSSVLKEVKVAEEKEIVQKHLKTRLKIL